VTDQEASGGQAVTDQETSGGPPHRVCWIRRAWRRLTPSGRNVRDKRTGEPSVDYWWSQLSGPDEKSELRPARVQPATSSRTPALAHEDDLPDCFANRTRDSGSQPRPCPRLAAYQARRTYS
jgi:hypothetical protein